MADLTPNVDTPKIDPRTAADLEAQVARSLAQRLPQFRLDPTQPGVPKPLSGNHRALVKIFARFGEIILQRLNQVPDKNFLAFLDLLGASRLPPQPARVALTFTLAAGSTVDGVVPAGTQVAAPPAPGESDPVLFETERELVVTAAQLDAVFVRDPGRDTWGDRTPLTLTPASQSAFRGDRPVEHSFYVGHAELLGFREISALSVILNLAKVLGDGGTAIEWQIWVDGEQTWRTLTTQSFAATGLQTVNLGQLSASEGPSIPLRNLNGITSRWLRARLNSPITPHSTPQLGMVRTSQLPTLQTAGAVPALTLTANFARTNLSLDQVIINATSIDLAKPWFAFTEKPKFGDAFYIAHAESFAKAGAVITLQVTVINPVQAGQTAPPTNLNLTLQWEVWNGAWFVLGTSTPQNSAASRNVPDFEDQTRALTIPGAQTVRFTLPSEPNNRAPRSLAINGIEDYWLRVRIVSGSYGQDAGYQAAAAPVGSPGRDANGNIYVLRPATFTPPMIGAIAVSYTWTRSDVPDAVLLYNDAVYSDNLVQKINGQNQLPATPIAPFQSIFTTPETAKPSLYFGFTLPPNRTQFPNRTLSLYGRVADLAYGAKRIPLDPLQSWVIEAARAIATHRFEFVNDSDRLRSFRLTCLRTTWTTTPAPASFTLAARASQIITIQVQVPAASPASVDLGILRITVDGDAATLYTAQFQTQRGGALPVPERLQHRWDYWNGSTWESLTVQDETENLTQSGVISLLPPATFAPRADFGLSPRYWLRLQWQSGDYSQEPQLQRFLLNTTLASQTVTLRNEILGSSDGSGNQRFQVVQMPILAGPQLYVREPELLSGPEQTRLVEEEGPDALDIRRDANDRPLEIWVRWHEMPDFYSSTPRDRHYVLDHLTGELQFGDGINGLIPPMGIGNLRLARYQTGGGVSGNRPAGTIVQLKTTVPYVEKVVNLEPASGGADAESLERLRDRMPKTIRHRDRAVTLEDYEDLAMLASPAVARAKCVPLSNLQRDPFDLALNQTGTVSVIIVPRSPDPKPLPSLELIDRIQTYLDTHSAPTASVFVVGPLYIQVRLTLTLALKQLEGASAIEQTVSQRLTQFLHPLTGGFDGDGWAFGRAPHKSDFYRLLESIPGIDHVHSLSVTATPEAAQTPATKRFLVYSGKHTINFIFESD